LIASGPSCKPCQQRQDDASEDGKKDQFPDDMQQKRHEARSEGEVAVCRSSIRADYTADLHQEVEEKLAGGPSYREAKGGAFDLFSSQKSCTHHHRLLTACRRQ
jgi:hypothetical protein